MKRIKSIRGIKIPTKQELAKKIQIFESEYDIQSVKIKEKIKIAKGENLKRILEYKEDLDKLKRMSEEMKMVMNKKGIRGHFSKTKFFMITSKRYLIFCVKMGRKYKKENSDIDNFPV